MALGITDGDWSGWYRLFSKGRYEEQRVSRIFFRETLEHTREEEPYVTGVDGEQFEDGWDGLAESTQNTCVQSWDSSSATFFTWLMVDTDGGRV
jgi:hypothetical protein